MIFEFALDPELVASWHKRNNYLFFEEKFGPVTGRIVSKCPKKWRKMVWEAFLENYSYDLFQEHGDKSGQIFINLEVQNNQVDAEEIGRVIFESMQAKFFEDVERDPYERFEIALRATNDALNGFRNEKSSGYIGNLKTYTVPELRAKKPTKIIENSVYGMLPKNKLRDDFMKRLKVYAGKDHPHVNIKFINQD